MVYTVTSVLPDLPRFPLSHEQQSLIIFMHVIERCIVSDLLIMPFVNKPEEVIFNYKHVISYGHKKKKKKPTSY